MNDSFIIDKEGLNQLIHILAEKGYQVVGPTVRDEAIIYDKIFSIEDLPGSCY